jgi:hypothetical protein
MKKLLITVFCLLTFAIACGPEEYPRGIARKVGETTYKGRISFQPVTITIAEITTLSVEEFKQEPGLARYFAQRHEDYERFSSIMKIVDGIPFHEDEALVLEKYDGKIVKIKLAVENEGDKSIPWGYNWMLTLRPEKDPLGKQLLLPDELQGYSHGAYEDLVVHVMVRSPEAEGELGAGVTRIETIYFQPIIGERHKAYLYSSFIEIGYITF